MPNKSNAPSRQHPAEDHKIRLDGTDSPAADTVEGQAENAVDHCPDSLMAGGAILYDEEVAHDIYPSEDRG
jgi:hypothetical protein